MAVRIGIIQDDCVEELQILNDYLQKGFSQDEAARTMLKDSFEKLKSHNIQYKTMIHYQGIADEDAFDNFNSGIGSFAAHPVKVDNETLEAAYLMIVRDKESGKPVGHWGVEEKIVQNNPNYVSIRYLTDYLDEAENKTKIDVYNQRVIDNFGPAYISPEELKQMRAQNNIGLAQVIANQELMMANQGELLNNQEFILEYTSQFDLLADKVGDLKIYVEDNIGGDGKKVANAYKQMKNGEISKKTFVGKALKIVGPKVLKKVLSGGVL